MIQNNQRQESYQNNQSESSQAILERIRQKLGLTSENGTNKSHQNNMPQMNSPLTRGSRSNTPQMASKMNSTHQSFSIAQPIESSFDDFSFDSQSLDFAKQSQSEYSTDSDSQSEYSTDSDSDNSDSDSLQYQFKSSKEMNSLLRSYNVNNQNSYKSNQDNSEWSEFEDDQDTDQDSLNLEEYDDNNDTTEDEYEEDDAIEDEYEEDFAQFEESLDDQESGSNVHFLHRQHSRENSDQEFNMDSPQNEQEFTIGEEKSNEQHFNLAGQNGYEQEFNFSHPNNSQDVQQNPRQQDSSSESLNLSTKIENAITQAINVCVSEWCNANLESLCREVIQAELTKIA